MMVSDRHLGYPQAVRVNLGGKSELTGKHEVNPMVNLGGKSGKHEVNPEVSLVGKSVGKSGNFR